MCAQSRVAVSELLIVLTLLLCSGLTAWAVVDQDVPIIRSDARLVVVDLLATDRDGSPRHGLKIDTFQVLEDGAPQQINSFEEHAATTGVNSSPERLTLPPGVYSNWKPVPQGKAVNILLLDSLNTAWHDQVYVRMQMIKYLQKLPQHEPVALFTLGTRLRMVQDFTANSEELVAAAKTITATTGPNEHGIENLQDINARIARMFPGATGHASRSLAEWAQEEQGAAKFDRYRRTHVGIEQLAKAVAALPGRKNLIWLAGDFGAAKKVLPLLTAQRIALYPVDAAGLLTLQPGADRSGDALASQTLWQVQGLGQAKVQPNGYITYLSTAKQKLLQQQGEMSELAAQTGGKAFFSTNDLSNAMSQAIDSGRSYYTLTYTPSNKALDGKTRKIEVKQDDHNVKLIYRKAYVAKDDDWRPSDDDARKMLSDAVLPTVPESTMLILAVHPFQQSGSMKTVQIDVSIAGSQLGHFEKRSGEKQARLQSVAVAWDKDYRNVGQSWQSVTTDVPKQNAAELSQKSVLVRHSMELPPGEYQLRIGVLDLSSRRIGTVNVPFRVQ